MCRTQGIAQEAPSRTGYTILAFLQGEEKYREDDEQDDYSGQFIQLSSGRYVSQAMPSTRTSGRCGKPCKLVEVNNGSYLTIEVRTRMGMVIRIQGVITPVHLRELIATGNV